MKQYQTIIGLALVAAAIVAAALILQCENTTTPQPAVNTRELSKDEKSKVETRADFKSFLVNMVSQYQMSQKEKGFLFKDRREENCLTFDIYNGNTNVFVKSVCMKVSMSLSSKARSKVGASAAKTRLYRTEVDCAPLSSKTVYIQCFNTPDPLIHTDYNVEVISIKGKDTNAAKE